MTKKIAYERKGKFGNEYLIPLNELKSKNRFVHKHRKQ